MASVPNIVGNPYQTRAMDKQDIRELSLGFASFCAALGVVIYAGVGVVTLLKGGVFLDYGVLLHNPEHGQELGILLVELGVFTTVFGSMVAFFYSFTGRRMGRS